MDLERVLKMLLPMFEKSRIRYAALGGFALAALGVQRNTMDLDFLVHRDDLESVHQLMTALRYGRRIITENVSHYVHPEAAWGSVDFLHAFRSYSQEMLERAQDHPLFSGVLHIKVLQPEDVIGFKIQAIANNPLRAGQDRVDIESLMSHYRNRLDWNRIQRFYELFEQTDEGRRLRERFDHAE